VNPSANHTADNVCPIGFYRWWGRMKIHIETMEYICARIMHQVINVSCIALTLCSTTWTKLWWDPQDAGFPGGQELMDGCHCEGKECRVDLINQ